jgi:hypothetical protein
MGRMSSRKREEKVVKNQEGRGEGRQYEGTKCQLENLPTEGEGKSPQGTGIYRREGREYEGTKCQAENCLQKAREKCVKNQEGRG